MEPKELKEHWNEESVRRNRVQRNETACSMKCPSKYRNNVTGYF